MDGEGGGEGGRGGWGEGRVHPRLKFSLECESDKIQENKIWYCKTIAGIFFFFFFFVCLFVLFCFVCLFVFLFVCLFVCLSVSSLSVKIFFGM